MKKNQRLPKDQRQLQRLLVTIGLNSSLENLLPLKRRQRLLITVWRTSSMKVSNFVQFVVRRTTGFTVVRNTMRNINVHTGLTSFRQALTNMTRCRLMSGLTQIKSIWIFCASKIMSQRALSTCIRSVK